MNENDRSYVDRLRLATGQEFAPPRNTGSLALLREFLGKNSQRDDGTGSGGANGANYLQASTTVFNDHTSDQLCGHSHGSPNWFWYSFGQDGANRTKVADAQVNTT